MASALQLSKLKPIKSELKSILHSLEDDDVMFDTIFNAILVWVGVRRASFPDNLRGADEKEARQNRELLQRVLDLMNSTQFEPKIKFRQMDPDDPYVLLIYTDPTIDQLKTVDRKKQLGELLGFRCAGHDYGNRNLDRIGMNIFIHRKTFQFETYSEYCVKSQTITFENMKSFIKHKTDAYNQIAKQFGYRAKSRIIDEPSIATRMNNIDDSKYFKQHIEHYTNDIGNDWSNDTRLTDLDYKELKEQNLLELVKFAFRMGSVFDIFTPLYPDPNERGISEKVVNQRREKIFEIERTIRQFEDDLASTPVLLKMSYIEWTHSPIFWSILEKYPILKKAFEDKGFAL